MRERRLNRALNKTLKALFVFWLGVYFLETWIFDINPLRLKVVGTFFSISYFQYITLFDLVHYFWGGLLILAVIGTLFAFSKYLYIMPAIIAFYVVFYYQILRSIALVDFYKATYACHTVYTSTGYGGAYICPLDSMVSGHPNIPLQGNVLSPIALSIAVASLAIWRYNAGLTRALLEMISFGSGVLLVFETGIYFFQREWYNQKVTDYQDLLHFGNLTNSELFIISLIAFVIAFSGRLALAYLKKNRKELPRIGVTTPIARELPSSDS